jgi:catechol 2,3-dioxygenase-like lactoylglutathione lyase family enzyme
MPGKPSLWVRAGAQYVHISDSSGPPVTGNFYHFAIGFENFRDFLDELVAKGVDVFNLDKDISEIDVNQNFDDGMRQFFVRDPDGNLVEIFDINSRYYNP